MKKIVIVLDASGSMSPIASDVTGTLRSLAEEHGDTPMSLIAFNSGVLGAVQGPATALRNYAYRPGGGTALYDAIGTAFAHIEKDTLLVIITDGEENASRAWNRERVGEILPILERLGTGVAFLGANFDAFAVGGSMNISPASTRGYVTTQALGMNLRGDLLRATSTYAATGTVNFAGGDEIK